MKNIFFAVLIIIGLVPFAFSQEGQEGQVNNPCLQEFTEVTTLCFENSSQNKPACIRTICVKYNVKPDKLALLGNCPFPSEGFCLTLGIDETGCINLPHPAGDLTDWFDLEITVFSHASYASVSFDGPGLETSIKNQTGYISHKSGGCNPNYKVLLETINGRDFVITEVYLLGE